MSEWVTLDVTQADCLSSKLPKKVYEQGIISFQNLKLATSLFVAHTSSNIRIYNVL
jgi:nitrogen fixation protein